MNCSICLKIVTKELEVKLECSHYFHRECITEWVKLSNDCPYCRSSTSESFIDNYSSMYKLDTLEWISLKHNSILNEKNMKLVYGV